MLSRWQAAPIWALLAKSGGTDASAALQRISFLSAWLCCCMSDQLQNLPAWPPAPPCSVQDSWRALLSWGQPEEQRGRGAGAQCLAWVSLMALWHLPSSSSLAGAGLSRAAGNHSERHPQGSGSRTRTARQQSWQGEECAQQKGVKAAPVSIPCAGCFCGIRAVYRLMCLHLWVGVALPAVQRFLRSC